MSIFSPVRDSIFWYTLSGFFLGSQNENEKDKQCYYLKVGKYHEETF